MPYTLSIKADSRSSGEEYLTADERVPANQMDKLDEGARQILK